MSDEFVDVFRDSFCGEATRAGHRMKAATCALMSLTTLEKYLVDMLFVPVEPAGIEA
jgi:hypothetical protein